MKYSLLSTAGCRAAPKDRKKLSFGPRFRYLGQTKYQKESSLTIDLDARKLG